MHSAEGFWMFCGPPDTASYNAFGTIFNYHGDLKCFPTTTLRYHEKFPQRGTFVQTEHGGEYTKDTIYENTEITQVATLFPDELFMRKIEGLGFNRNHEIVRLMPLLKYVSEKSI